MKSRKNEICSEEDCTGPHYSSGKCRKHYNESYRQPVVDNQKKCSGCQHWLPLARFGAGKRPDPYCRDCRSIRAKDGYLKNKEQMTERCEKDRKRRQATNRGLVIEYFLAHPCVDCGESDPVVLEFDHVVGDKKAAICQMISGYSWDNILIEITKCQVRCANCHRRRTHDQFGYWGKGGGAK